MEKEFIPYEQALALKELGFDEACFAIFGKSEGDLFKVHIDKFDAVDELHFIKAPTFSQAFRWFRKKYGAEFYITDRRHTSVKYYEVSLFDGDRTDMVFGKSLTYEEAESECLKKLIKIINHG